jgi:uncharacterized protein (TIGR02996 family)
MNEEQAFLAAIAANPSDATARLVFADWLTERDDPRGEWLRVRTQLALGTDPAVELTRYEDRERELAPTVLADWFALDLPMWCLLGGGLAYPAVPGWLVKQNTDSWAGAISYYSDVPEESWVSQSGIQHFVAVMAGTEFAKLFRVDLSEFACLVSTSDSGGLGDEYVWVAPRDVAPRLRLGYVAPHSRYGPPNESESVSAECDGPIALRADIGRLLARLWCDTRGLMSVYEM